MLCSGTHSARSPRCGEQILNLVAAIGLVNQGGRKPMVDDRKRCETDG
jgi:hypothetical protein